MKWLKEIPERLTRITSSGRYIPVVDGLRFMAIMPVLIQHLSERFIRYSGLAVAPGEGHLAFLASRGTIGVFLFFAISGFILGLPFARHFTEGGGKPDLRAYFWRRLTRLEPPYILWMICFFVVLLIKGDYSYEALFPHLATSLFYLHNIVYNDYSWINPVAWSLEIEIQFYLLAPFLAWLFFSVSDRLRRRALLLGSIALIIALQHVMGWQTTMPYKATILGQLQHFLVGFFAADLYLTGWLTPTVRRRGWDIVGLAGFTGLLYTWSAEPGKNLLFIAALILFFIAAFRGRTWYAFLGHRWVAAVGGLCYTIYLIHLPLMEGLVRLSRHLAITGSYALNMAVQIAVVIPLILAISAALFLLFEKPFMDKNWPAKLIERMTEWRRRGWVLKKETAS